MSSEDCVKVCCMHHQDSAHIYNDDWCCLGGVYNCRSQIIFFKWVSCYCERRWHCGRHEQEVLQDGYECKLHQSDAEYRKFLFCFSPLISCWLMLVSFSFSKLSMDAFLKKLAWTSAAWWQHHKPNYQTSSPMVWCWISLPVALGFDISHKREQLNGSSNLRVWLLPHLLFERTSCVWRKDCKICNASQRSRKFYKMKPSNSNPPPLILPPWPLPIPPLLVLFMNFLKLPDFLSSMKRQPFLHHLLNHLCHAPLPVLLLLQLLFMPQLSMIPS